jgi:hypothetical protein
LLVAFSAIQVYLLNKRFSQQQQIIWSGRGGVQDRTIYEDSVFARVCTASIHARTCTNMIRTHSHHSPSNTFSNSNIHLSHALTHSLLFTLTHLHILTHTHRHTDTRTRSYPHTRTLTHSLYTHYLLTHIFTHSVLQTPTHAFILLHARAHTHSLTHTHLPFYVPSDVHLDSNTHPLPPTDCVG